MIDVKMVEASNNSNCLFRVLKKPVLIDFVRDVCDFCWGKIFEEYKIIAASWIFSLASGLMAIINELLELGMWFLYEIKSKLTSAWGMRYCL